MGLQYQIWRTPRSDLARHSIFAKMQLSVNVGLDENQNKSGALDPIWHTKTEKK